MNYQKFVKIMAIVLIIILLIAGGYYFWQWLDSKGGIKNIIDYGKPPITSIIDIDDDDFVEPIEEDGTDIISQEPQIVAQKLSILVNSPVFEYWSNPEENSLYFANLNGQIVRINNDGTRQLVISQTLNNLHNIKASNDGSFAVAEFNYPQMPTLSIFSASSTNWTPLPIDTISASFSPDSKKIAYTDQNNLNILDLTSQETSKIQEMSQVGLRLNWIKDSELLFYGDSSIESRGYAYSFNLEQKTLKTLIDGEYGLNINWDKNGDSGIKMGVFERKPKLSLIDNFGNTTANFTFLSMPEKCLIESQKIYCGVPKNIRDGITLPDDYYKKAEYFIDDIFMIDRSEETISKIFDGSEVALDIYNLKIKDDSLLFINRYDNKLYSLKLE
ncbi:hypothetical protein KJ671_01195 [Patescibacteria group bacterium]|nr:hypothetical protein [Patescibacteria group bacterium]